MQRHHNLQGFKGSKKDNFQKKFGAGGINSFSRLGEPYKQCPLHTQRMHFYLHTPLQALHVGLLQIKMPQPYGWGIDLWSWRDLYHTLTALIFKHLSW
jgi:hypothetical protein